MSTDLTVAISRLPKADRDEIYQAALYGTSKRFAKVMAKHGLPIL